MSRIARWKRFLVPMILGCTALAISGCFAGGNAEAEAKSGHAAILDAAKDEGTLTWYTSIPEGVAKATTDAFEEKYDISVETIVLTSGLLAARYAEEMESGSSPADVITVADPTFFADAVKNDWVSSLDKDDMPSLVDWPKNAVRDDAYALVNIQPIGVTYDTKKASADDFTDWKFLTDPSYKGEIYLVDPTKVPNWLAHMELLREEYGDAFLEKLGDQSPKIVDSSVPGTQQVTAGSGTLVYPGLLSVSTPLKDEGATVDTVFPSPTTGVEQYAALSAEAPQPNAARLFMDFLLTEDAQKILNKGTGSSPLGHLEGTVPLPDGYVSPDFDKALAAKSDIVADLGLG